MKLKNLASVVVVLLVVGLAVGFNAKPSAPSMTPPAGKIAGVVLDDNDARIVNATIKIESGTIKRTQQSSDQGKFEISLPAGSYELTVEANGFRRFIFSPLEVKPGQTEIINVHLEVARPAGLTPAFTN